MKKISLILIMFLFTVSLISASSTYRVQHDYYEDDVKVKTVYYDFDKYSKENEDRYSVWDYREGYTFRTSKEYLEKKYTSQNINRLNSVRNNARKEGHVFYRYVPYLRSYEEKICYNSAPEGKIFYIKC